MTLPESLVVEYADRVGLKDSASTWGLNLETLSAVIHAHVYNVPFENLDLHLGRYPLTDPDACWDKLVRRRRGGYCHEHIRVLERVLRALGFNVAPATGQVLLPGSATPEGTHAFLLVTLEGTADVSSRTYLVDASFPMGQVPAPILVSERGFEETPEQALAEGLVLKVCKDADGKFTRYLKNAEGGWDSQWTWDGEALKGDPAMFEKGAAWVNSDPGSPFLNNIIISKPLLGGGRLTLSGLRRIETGPDGKKTKTAITREEFVSSLRDDFGIQELDGFFSTQSDAPESPFWEVL